MKKLTYKNINRDFNFEKENRKNINFYFLLNIIIIALYTLLIILYIIPYIENMSDTLNVLKEVQYIPATTVYDTSLPKITTSNPLVCIEYHSKYDYVLNNFLNLFSKSSNQYFPSYFVPNSVTKPSGNNILNIILENQYYIFDNSISNYRSCLFDISVIVNEYLSSI